MRLGLKGQSSQPPRRCVMADTTSKVPVKSENVPVPQMWRPFESLRQEIDRLFDEFDGGFWRAPFRTAGFNIAPSRNGNGIAAMPAVDVSETDKAFEITAELP